MAWGRIDDGFWCHPKVLRAGNAGAGALVRMIAYCNQHLTDGVVPPEAAVLIDPTGIDTTRLVEVGLLTPNDDGCYVVHDFLEYNKSRDVVLKEREDARVRQQRARCKKAGHPKPTCECSGVTSPEVTAVSHRDTAVTSEEVFLPRPDPTRPDPYIDQRDDAPNERKKLTPVDFEKAWQKRTGGTIGAAAMMWIQAAIEKGVTLEDVQGALSTNGNSYKYLAKAAISAAAARQEAAVYTPQQRSRGSPRSGFDSPEMLAAHERSKAELIERDRQRKEAAGGDCPV